MAKRTMSAANLKNKALCLLSAWLEHAGIGCQVSDLPGHDLRVATKDGGLIEVQVLASYPIIMPVDSVVVLAGDIASPDRATSTAALHLVTDACGYGEPDLLDRGSAPEKIYGDQHDLVVFRHRVFRQVPNPPEAVFKRFESTINMVCNFFLNQNREACSRLGFEVDDLRSYAHLWTANYWGTNRVMKANATEDEDHKLLYRYLRQRFAEFYKQMFTRSRNVFADKDTIGMALDVEYVVDADCYDDDGRQSGLKAVSKPKIEFEYDDHTTGHDVPEITEKARRKGARDQLRTGLGRMDCDTLVGKLKHFGESKAVCADTRKEAQKQLKLHQKSCNNCAPGA